LIARCGQKRSRSSDALKVLGRAHDDRLDDVALLHARARDAAD
jgi:hypothetical protein